MKSTQAAWGWLTAGVLALGLNGIYHDFGTRWAHNVMSRSLGAVAVAPGHAAPLLAQATRILASYEAAACPTARARVKIQSACKRGEFARLDGMEARLEGALASLEAARTRMAVETTELREGDMAVNDSDLGQVGFPVVVPKIHVMIAKPLMAPVMKMQCLADGDDSEIEGKDPI